MEPHTASKYVTQAVSSVQQHLLSAFLVLVLGRNEIQSLRVKSSSLIQQILISCGEIDMEDIPEARGGSKGRCWVATQPGLCKKESEKGGEVVSGPIEE